MVTHPPLGRRLNCSHVRACSRVPNLQTWISPYNAAIDKGTKPQSQTRAGMTSLPLLTGSGLALIGGHCSLHPLAPDYLGRRSPGNQLPAFWLVLAPWGGVTIRRRSSGNGCRMMLEPSCRRLSPDCQ